VPRRLHGVGDLSDDDIQVILDRAGELAAGAAPARRTGVVGLAFFETSLRTRVGFEVAAVRTGLHPVVVDGRRASSASMPESLHDTVRVLAGYVDGLIVRSSRPSPLLAGAMSGNRAWLNAGDGGTDAEHPSQALIDVFAMERLRGPITTLRVAICGDLRMRAARSLTRLLERLGAAEIVAVTDPSLQDGGSERLALPVREAHDLADVDVLYAAGIPHGTAPEPVRNALRVDRLMLETLPSDAIVLSPMPIIDEVAGSARGDARMRYLEQSDAALHVRIALLEHLMR
jgi:aspartate carbamoyltransferase catalytic subunit